MYPQVLCKCHFVDELSKEFPIPRNIFMSTYVTSLIWKSCFIHSQSFGDSWKIALTRYFPLLDFCGKPKPSSEFCVQFLGLIRVWSSSVAQTPSYVHVIMTAHHWCSIQDVGGYCSKERLNLFTFLSAAESICPEDGSSFTNFVCVFQRTVKFGRPKVSAHQGLWSTLSLCFTFCWKESAKIREGLSEPAGLFFWLDSDNWLWAPQQQTNSCSQCIEVVIYADLIGFFHITSPALLDKGSLL